MRTCLLPPMPDLVIIGGISRDKDHAASRDVAGQNRAAHPGREFRSRRGL